MKARLKEWNDLRAGESAPPASQALNHNSIVAVRMKRLVLQEKGGIWNDLGIKFLGRLTNGGQVRVGELENGTPQYLSHVAPAEKFAHDQKHGDYGNTHPRPITDYQPEDVYTDDGEYVATVCFVVEVAGQVLADRLIEIEKAA